MTLRDLWLRGRALMMPRHSERDLDDELAFHVECETRKLIDRGTEPAEAARQARAHFGSRTAVADDCRDARGIGVIETVLRDVAYAWRTFRRAPLPALTIVVTMTLGLGVATAAFSTFNAVFMRVDAVSRPQELYAVRRPVNGRAWVPFTAGEHESFSRENAVFSGTAALSGPIDVRHDGRLLKARLVSGSFFQVLGVVPTEGRVLTPADDRPDAVTALVLSHRGWKRLFAGDSGVVGRHIRINSGDAEIVGIMPDGFFGLGAVPPDFWGPLAALAQFTPASKGREASAVVEVVGRLEPGLSPASALDSLRGWAAGPGLKRAGREPVAIALRSATGLTADIRDVVPVFGAISVAFWLVLLIACANVANLLLARGLTRRQEIGVRLSLGASRRRVIRQLLTENLLLASVAAVCAYPFARLIMEAGVMLTATYSPPEMAEQLNVAIPGLDWHVLLFLVVTAMLATGLFGIAPALQASAVDPGRMMQGQFAHGLPRSRARRVLIAVQVAASALLLITAATFLRGVFTAAEIDSGLRTDSVVIVSVANEPRRQALLRALDADPGVTKIAAASRAGAYRTTFAQAASTQIRAGFLYRLASRDFLDVMGIGVVRGRGFGPSERGPDAAVVLVSERSAKRLWPGRDAVGQILRLSLESDLPRSFTVIGVVHSLVLPMRDSGLDADLYLPADLDTPDTELALRVRDDPFRARGRLIEQLTRVDPALGAVTTLRTIVGVMGVVMRALFALGMALGGLALLLTVSGLFSVLSYIVEQRAREIGVRMALGASARRVARLVFVESGIPVSIGLAAGGLLAGAVAGAVMASPLAEEIGTVVRVFDPAAYLASLLIIVFACGVAASVPAVRAARINPSVMLRKE